MDELIVINGMDKLSVIGKIGTILSDLQKQQEFFEGHPDSLNEVEVELFAASASYLAEYAKVLKKFPVNRIGKSLAPPPPAVQAVAQDDRSEEHTPELQSLMRIS